MTGVKENLFINAKNVIALPLLENSTICTIFKINIHVGPTVIHIFYNSLNFYSFLLRMIMIMRRIYQLIPHR